MNRLFLLLLGIIISSIGLTFIILYLNLISIGYSLIDYLKYILTNFYSLLFIVGIIIIYIAIKIIK